MSGSGVEGYEWQIELQRCSSQLIPHYALNPETLPRKGAPWSEVVYFAGTFDGYVIKPNASLHSAAVDDARRQFLATGALPEGFTQLRTALFGEQRRDHFTESASSGDRETTRFISVRLEPRKPCVR
jgi:hypothetical protein